MFKKLVWIAIASLFFTGCASVPMESADKSAAAKEFNAPATGKSGLYIYRSGSFGGALKKDVWVDGRCIGETAPDMFFYVEVDGDKEHKVSTESEFSPNDLMLTTQSGALYFIRQYIKFGVLVGGAGLELVDEQEGKSEVRKLDLAINGVCSK